MGSLATSSIRGGNAGHTLVLWNGLPIQSPMLGLLDLSLLPLQAVDRLSLQRGGNTALWGSGAVGGLISLDNVASDEPGIAFSNQTSFGSFDHFQQALDLSVSSKKWESRTRFTWHDADNDFFYKIRSDLPKRQQTNAALQQQNLNQDMYWRPNGRHRFGLHYWRQSSDRQIPPTNVQTRSEAYQIDQSDRLVLDWRFVGEKASYQAKFAAFNEDLDYFDPQIRLSSPSNFYSLLGELTGQWYGKNDFQFLTGFTQNYTRAIANGYQVGEKESRQALFASITQRKTLWQWQLSLRQAWLEGEWIPLVPALAADFQVLPYLTIKVKISRNYRLPTLNDRFWQPGGNPALEAESGWSQELTILCAREKNTFRWRASITPFNRQINNWILWSIKDGQSFWSANNIAAVWSRGLENSLELSYQLSHFRMRLMLGYDYTRSTNQVALDNPKIAAGEQLLYTPIHQGFGHLILNWKSFHLNYSHRLVGSSQGISDPIAPFDLGQAGLRYQVQDKKVESQVFLQINNIWNQTYLVVERRPMPGIHYQFGIKLSYYNKKQ